MFRVLCCLLSAVLFPILAEAQGHRLEVAIHGLEDSTIYLAHHYGDLQLMKDTITLDSKGRGLFQGNELLPRGLYLVVFPGKTSYFEILVDEDQHFSLETWRDAPASKMKVTGNTDNEVFFNDLRFIQTKKEEYTSLQAKKERLEEQCAEDSTHRRCDSIAIINKRFKDINAQVELHRGLLMEENKNSLYAYILRASENPKIPPAPRDELGNLVDSNWDYHYYKSHFFDAIDFTDDRILRTGIYHQKLKTYIETLVVQHPDSIIKEADWIISRSLENDELFKYTAAWILNKYAKNELVCMDKIYVHVAEKYYMSGMADWVGEEQLKTIARDAMKMKPCTCGSTGRNITATDINGVTRSLYDIKADYTILLFIESDCGLCQKATPKVYDYWLTVRDQGVSAMCIAMDLLPDKWRKYITEKGYTEWINLIDPEDQSKFRENYHVISTPLIYILDKDKKILAKRLGADQLPEYMSFLMKNKDRM